MSTWNVDAANQALADHFAPWVTTLDLSVEEVGPQSAVLRMRFNDGLCREGGIVCGQAFAALADTAMVIAMLSASGGYRPMATIDLHASFMRAVAHADVIAHAQVERLGRTLAFTRVVMRARAIEGSGTVDPDAVVATSVATFALP